MSKAAARRLLFRNLKIASTNAWSEEDDFSWVIDRHTANFHLDRCPTLTIPGQGLFDILDARKCRGGEEKEEGGEEEKEGGEEWRR